MSARGHVLVEVMIGGAILAWAMVGLTAGMISATKDNGQAGQQQVAAEWLQAKVEALQQTSLPTWEDRTARAEHSAERQYTEADPGPAAHPDWTRVVSWLPRTTDVYRYGSPGLKYGVIESSPLITHATFFHATVTVTFSGGAKTLTAEALRWTGR